MSSYHQDLNKFEELLAYRNERALTEWEETEFWNLIEKHPRFIELISRDSQNEALLDSFSDEEFKEMGFRLPAKNIIKFPDTKQDTIVTSYDRNMLWKAASVLVAGVILVFIYSSLDVTAPLENRPSNNDSIAIVEQDKNQELSPQEQYEQQIAKIPLRGSMDRPPTSFSSTNPAQGEELSFGRDIRPILSEYCFHCHGPDEGSREAKLRLDTADGMLKKDAIVPGHPEKSEVIARIFLDDPDEIMPPPKSHKTMKLEEKEKLKLWIKQGAKWQGHWAFEKPEKSTPPKVETIGWDKNPIDQFVYKKMREKGLSPNPKADPYVLARRLALDLTGLPLSLNKIKTYVEQDPKGNLDALVDDLMASKSYGEHRAHYWLDAARYGDTHGMHLDNYREMWPYRDWVIKAFNENMPFDKFTIDQFAGDLLPGSTIDQKIATGFHRNNVTTSEGGSIPEEFKVRYNVDRVATTGSVYMGLTVACSQCHDHKFDPISQKEFYQMFAFFNHTTQNPMDGNKKDSPPFLRVEIGEGKSEYDEKMALKKTYKAKLDEYLKEDLPEQLSIDTNQLVAMEGLSFHANFKQPNEKGEIAVLVAGQSQTVKTDKEIVWSDNVHLDGALEMNSKKGLSFNKVGDFEANDKFSFSFWYKPLDDKSKTLMVKIEKPEKHVGWQLKYEKKKIVFQMNSNEQYEDSLKVTSNLALQQKKWNYIGVSYSGGRTDKNFHIFINGKKASLSSSHRHNKITGTIKNSVPITIGRDLKQGALADIRIYEREMNEEEFGLLYRLKDIENHLLADRTKLKAEQLNWLKKAHLTSHNDAYRKEVSEYFKLSNRTSFLYDQFPTTLIMEEQKDGMAMANILDRGEYDRKRDEVTPAVPAVLGAWKDEYPKNRLGLAKWIMSKDNPLTARVTVNRIWQEFFGHGIVKTADDFGAMGTRPTHPKLLDWLAVEFMESGWDMKHIVRLIVTSQTYQQSSRYRDEHYQVDPENSFLSRGPRFRLHAEALRDQALAVSGLLVDKVGGPSVKPYQPDGIWKAVAYTRSNTAKFVRDHGDSLYRRSIYTFWKRTAPPASMAVFDAPSRENCTVKRERTNTPMQALNLMNDEQYVEAARYFAERMIRDVKSDMQRIRTMGYSVLGYPPNERELAMMNQALKKYETTFSEQPDHAKAFVKIGEMPTDTNIDPVKLASWTMLASTLMNRDDVINKN